MGNLLKHYLYADTANAALQLDAGLPASRKRTCSSGDRKRQELFS